MSNEIMSVRKARKLSGQRTRFQDVWHRLKKNKIAMISLAVICLYFLMAICSVFLVDYDKDVIGINVMERLQTPSAEHIMGTDDVGRDVFSRIVYGSRYSLAVGLGSVAISAILGVIIGCVAAYYGGRAENLIMRVGDIVGAVPGILLGIVIVTALGKSLLNLTVALGISGIVSMMYVSRSSILPVRGQEYVEAAKAIGMRDRHIIFREVLPNGLSYIIVNVTMKIGVGILRTSALSFIGMGIPAPLPEWGAMLAESRTFIRDYPYLGLFPGLAIMILVLAFNLFGDGLRDAMDPKLKGR